MYKIEYGEIVGSCVFIERVDGKGKNASAKFRCECGNVFETLIYLVRTGHTRSCGCYRSRVTAERNHKHGLSDHPLYGTWTGIKTRTTNKNDSHYKYYGARGIIMCQEWSDNFKAFHDYVIALPNAMRPGRTIDRINNDGNYEPGNIRWATHLQQAHNKQKSRRDPIS